MKYVKTTVSRPCPRHALRLYALPPPPTILTPRTAGGGYPVTTVHYPANFLFSFANYFLYET